MLEAIVLRDFQRHQKLRIKLDPRVTSIVGATDVGKSAVIRALRWVMLNQPSGSRAFIRHGCKRTRVSLKVDGKWIRRTRGAANTYHLDGKELKAFGTQVPDSVASLLKIRQLNFQRQHDPVFWLADSGGDVARALNEVVDLSAVDQATVAINRKVREATTRATVLKEQLESARDKVRSLGFVKQMELDFAAVEALMQEKLDLTETYRRLYDLVASVREAGETTPIVPDLGPLMALRDQVARVRLKHRTLSGIVPMVKEAVERLRLAGEAHAVGDYHLRRVKRDRCPLCGQIPKPTP